MYAMVEMVARAEIANATPIRVRGDRMTAAEERALEWATKGHRTHRRTTCVGGKSRRGSVMHQTFVRTNTDTDDRLDGLSITAHPLPLSARRNRGHRKPLRYTLFTQVRQDTE